MSVMEDDQPQVLGSDGFSSRRLEQDLLRLSGVLRDEPLAAIMYGSLELFHSNLLAWFFETLPGPADEVFGASLPVGNQAERFVAREHKHLDLVLSIPGKQRLVIENKVFSVPTARQLEDYRDLVFPTLEPPQGTAGVLLSVYKPAWIDGLRGWDYLGYDELAQRIEAALAGELPSYELETMQRYAKVARTLSQLADAVAVRDLTEPVAPAIDLVEVLQDQKLAMRLLKFRMHSIADLLGTAVSAPKSRTKADVTNGMPLLEWFVEPPMLPGGKIGWQLQSGQFRRALVVPPPLAAKGHGLDARFALAHQHEEWFDFDLVDTHIGTRGAVLMPKTKDGQARGFCRFDPDFIYRYKRPPADLTVGQLLAVTRAIHASLPSDDGTARVEPQDDLDVTASRMAAVAHGTTYTPPINEPMSGRE